MTTLAFRTTLAVAALAAAFGASSARAAQKVTFLCNAPAGHTCQVSIKTAAGPISFALPSGQKTEVAGVTPHADTYCVCDPGPVTADCKAPEVGKWCMGQWLAVDPGLNSENDTGRNAFAAVGRGAN